MMNDTPEENWKELTMTFVHDIASSITPIQGYSWILEAYLEKLSQEEMLPSVEISPGTMITPEIALMMIRSMRKQADTLRELKTTMSRKVGF